VTPALLEQVHAIGREVVGPNAAAVDRDARFPTESFAALKAARLLSCYVPETFGGMGLPITDVARICEILGQYCGNTSMIFAMHQIQVGCITHHALGAPFFQAYARRLVDEQLLLASATTEVGIGGDVRTSSCALQVQDGHFTLEKHAPVISYADDADAILVTARRAPDAGPHDQVHVLVPRAEASLTPLSTWDTLGFRGTVSVGYTLRATGPVERVLPAPYADIHARTMLPMAHLTWGGTWLGIASDATAHARAWVRAEARKTPGQLPPTAFRLAELDSVLFSMRAGVEAHGAEYQDRLSRPHAQDFGFALRSSNLKVATSRHLLDVVTRAMSICGIAAYRNDHPHSLCRHLRDAHGASLMVHNDRILGQTSAMQILQR
jgi:acyl-CoA dehydrogenase